MKMPIFTPFSPILACIALALGLLAPTSGAAETAADAPLCLPRTPTPPTIDGELTDPCWAAAQRLNNFTQPQTDLAPAQKIEARLCFNDTMLFVAVTCFEKTPAKIVAEKKADRGDLWMDDCVELFLRAVGDGNEFDQFILNTLSVQSTHRVHPDGKPGSKDQPFKTSWTAQAKVAADRWTAEFAIPLNNIGLDRPPAPGHSLQLKIGREDRAGGLPPDAKPDAVALATWPPRSKYAHAEDFATVFFHTDNLLRNPDFTEPGDNNQPFAFWNIDRQPGDNSVFAAGRDPAAKIPLLDIAAPAHYIALSQSLKLPPGAARFRLHCETKGPAGAYLRARVKLDPNEKTTRALTVDLAPSEDWTAHSLTFPAALDGEALIILGATENHKGAFQLRNLKLTAESAPPYQGPAIPAPASAVGDPPFVIEVLAPVDCRSLRGFIGAPIDGTVNTLGWNAAFWEYNRAHAGQGVGYAYNNSDGLHITLPDARGLDAVQIHGGIAADLYTGCTRYDDPASGNLLARFTGHTQHTLALFPAADRAPATQQPRPGDKLSFFHVSDGYIADINFFRFGKNATRQAKDLGTRLDCHIVRNDTTAKSLQPWIAQRFPTGNNLRCLAADPHQPIDANAGPLPLAPDTIAHIACDYLPADTPLAAVGLAATLENTTPGTLLQLQFQDPLAPRTALTTVVVALPGNGPLDLVIDIPDLILPAGKPLWLTLSAPAAKLSLSKPTFILYTTTREKALPETMSYRLTKLKGFFAAMSEARPWYSMWRTVTDVDAYVDGHKQFSVQLREIKDAVDYCHALDPDHDIATQYYNWFYRSNKKPPLKAPILPTPATHPDTIGAPDWAIAARAAWLTAREVPLWWLQNRAVPTGELGGQVGDDTDQFQNYADFPLFQRSGPTAQIVDCAERLAETAESQTLRAGLNRVTMDPLHAYEEGVNHEALMLWWHYGDPVYFERCLIAAKSLESLTTVNAAGHRHFKNQDCGAQDLDFDRPLGQDGFAHPLMLHPLFEVLWYNNNPRALKFVREWADSWLAHQKPGAYPGMIDVVTDQPVADSLAKEPFHSGYGGQQSAFAFMHRITGDAKYLQPVKDFLLAGNDPGGWTRCLPELYHAGFLDDLPPETLAALTAKSPALKWVATGDKQPFVAALQTDIAEIQTFRHMYTAAEVFTDRVFLYAITNPAVAYTGGFATRNKFHHTHAVSYDGFGDDFAALVRTARRDKLVVLLYNFRATPATGALRTWRLDHGQYRIEQGVDADGDDRADPIHVGEPGPAPIQELARSWPLQITLPPRQVTVLTLTQTEKLDPIEARADLALCAREIKIAADGTIAGVAHNIGAKDVRSPAVQVFDAQGRSVQRVALKPLPAPVDLTPSRVEFTLQLKQPLPADRRGWTIRLTSSPVDALPPDPEITQENNTVPVP